MRTLKIDIAEDTVSKIQRIHSETEARMLLLNRLMETHKDDASFIDSALFKKYHEEYSIGNVDDGICAHDCEKCRVVALKKVDRRTQSTDECFNCPIAEGCSWCTAYNYQVFGTPDARATFICVMHKARALGNIYFWNKYYRKHNMSTRMKMHIPDEWALEIISQSELDMLKELSKEDA